MKILFRLFPIAILLISCGDTDIWIQQASSRPAVRPGKVAYLETIPRRDHVVVGIITPPTGEYETLAEAVKEMKKVAAKHGADAIYIESQTQEGGWRFKMGGPGSWGGGSGGSFSEVTFRTKAIVWK